MKKTTLFLFLLIHFAVYSQTNSKTQEKSVGVIFESGTLSDAIKKAATNGPGLVFLDCYTSWCGPCKYVANNVFPTKEAGDFFNSNFVNIKIDMEKGEGPELVKKLGVVAFPTFIIFDSKGNEINRVLGSGDVKEFIERIKKAMDRENSPVSLLEKYNKSQKIDDAVKYMELLRSSYMQNHLDTFAKDLFYKLPAHKRYTSQLFPFFSSVIGIPGSKEFTILLDEKHIASKMLGNENVDRVICNGIKQYIRDYFLSTNRAAKDSILPNEDLLKYADYLSFFDNFDKSARYFREAAHLYCNGNLEELSKQLNARELYALPSSARNDIEYLFVIIKGIPSEAIEEYYEQIASILDKELNYTKARISRSKN